MSKSYIIQQSKQDSMQVNKISILAKRQWAFRLGQKLFLGLIWYEASSAWKTFFFIFPHIIV